MVCLFVCWRMKYCPKRSSLEWATKWIRLVWFRSKNANSHSGGNFVKSWENQWVNKQTTTQNNVIQTMFIGYWLVRSGSFFMVLSIGTTKLWMRTIYFATTDTLLPILQLLLLFGGKASFCICLFLFVLTSVKVYTMLLGEIVLLDLFSFSVR